MSTNTTNYNLTKPEPNDYYDIDVANENLDKIDAAINEKVNKTGDTITGAVKIKNGGEGIIFETDNGVNSSRIRYNANDTNNLGIDFMVNGLNSMTIKNPSEIILNNPRTGAPTNILNNVFNGISGSLSQDPNTSLEQIFLTNHDNVQNPGETGRFWYVIQYFYGPNSPNRVQLAMKYNATPDMKTRNYYVSGAETTGFGPWSDSIQTLKQSGVSAKTVLANALTAKGIPSNNNEDFSSFASKISTLGAPTISSSGVFTTNTASFNFPLLSGSSTVNRYYVAINHNLGKKPKYVRVWINGAPGSLYEQTVYDNRLTGIYANAMLESSYYSNDDTIRNQFAFNADGHITDTLIRLPVQNQGVTYNYYIEA